MLTAGVLLNLLVWTAAAAGAGRAQSVVYGLQTRDVGPTTAVSLLRLDAATLRELARIDLGEGSAYRPGAPFAWSPDKRRLVVATGSRIRFLVPGELRETGQVPLADAQASFVHWPTPRVVVALVGGEIWRIDPDTAAIMQRMPLGIVWDVRAAGRGTVLLTGSAELNACCQGSTLLLSRLGPDGRFRTARLSRLRTGVEPWRSRAGALLPPTARTSLELARREFARDRSVTEDAVEVLELRPASAFRCGFADSGSGYLVSLGANGVYARYSVTITRLIESNETPPFVCRKRTLEGRPPVSDYDLLRSTPGTWHVLDVPLVIGASNRKAFVVTSTGPIVEVDLRTLRARYRVLRRPLGADLRGDDPNYYPFARSWFSDRPVRVADRIAVSVGNRIKLVDTTRFSVRTLRRRDSSCSLAAAGNSLFLYGNFSCYGVAALDPRGRLRFRVNDPGTATDFQLGGRFGYASTVEDGESQVYVIDVRRGRLLRQVDVARNLALLLPPQRR